MALDGDILKALAKTAIFNRLQTEFTPDIPADLDQTSKDKITQSWTRIAEAVSDSMLDIINHIKMYGEVSTTVSTTVAVTSVSGVTPGVGVSGPGVGTGTGTGTGVIGSAIF